MMRLALLAIAFSLAGNASAQAAADFAAAEAYFHPRGEPIENIPKAHGVHGIAIQLIVDYGFPSNEQMAARGFASHDELLFHSHLCGAAAVAIGRVLRQGSAVSADHSQIFTRTEFALVATLYAQPGVAVGDRFSVIRTGGDIQLEGEQYSIVDAARPPYRKGIEYLLWLNADPARPAYYPFLETIEVRRSGALYPVLGFSPTPTVAQLKMQIGRIRNIGPCP